MQLAKNGDFGTQNILVPSARTPLGTLPPETRMNSILISESFIFLANRKIV